MWRVFLCPLYVVMWSKTGLNLYRITSSLFVHLMPLARLYNVNDGRTGMATVWLIIILIAITTVLVLSTIIGAKLFARRVLVPQILNCQPYIWLRQITLPHKRKIEQIVLPMSMVTRINIYKGVMLLYAGPYEVGRVSVPWVVIPWLEQRAKRLFPMACICHDTQHNGLLTRGLKWAARF